MGQLHVYGIRHHGPGSARALRDALERDRPDALCLEMPADFAEQLGDAELLRALTPPVALVAYDPQAVTEALYYPLARFSPEWVALSWAAEHGVPVVPVDLPAKLTLALAQAQRSGERPRRQAAVRRDPLGEMARLAGYRDRERWWERTFEIASAGEAVFPAVAEMIAALRESFPEAVDEECRLREAHMARELRRRIGEDQPSCVGMVCGAWHAPVLAEATLAATAKPYAKLRRGLRGPRLAQAWIPWTYERLRTASGYGAGVRSPVWYGLLYDDPQLATEKYLALTARELRAMGHASSVAQVIDAAALARSLASLRGLPLVGWDELREASLSALAEGSAERLASVEPAVQSLRTTGRVPPGAGELPLQRDLERRLREARLAKPYRDMEPVTRELDLRKASHLEASRLLCQLLLLDIPFGDRLESSAAAQGTFRERWHLHWRPEFVITLLSAHAYGQRIDLAAAAALRARLDVTADLDGLTRAVDLVILAGLFEELRDVTQRIRARAVATLDVWEVARALPPLLRLARYPSLRLTEADYLAELNGVLLPKLCSGLKAAVISLDDEAAYEAFATVKRLEPALALSPVPATAAWPEALAAVAYAKRAHPLLRGFAVRTLADRGRLDAAEADRQLQLNLGRGVLLRSAALFAEGFLYSSATVLVHQPAVFATFDTWLQTLTGDEFRSLLPALRRTASHFPVHERRKLSALVHRAQRPPTVAGAEHVRLPAVLTEALRGWLRPRARPPVG